ncbi:nudix hydrolase 12, mitochondrial-like isoform X6 [Musa acuminata AAA Group]|uniref:nudix hydrolase 12, mitochondrial-like isoform X6 n=1 Tax=Musa acuminata AAA Group TaxID=214697 RepID=UPI0031D04D97
MALSGGGFEVKSFSFRCARMSSSPLLSRKGRQQQRYDNQRRLVAGCIPYKLNREDDTQSDDLLDRVEVLMISSPGRYDLIFPKGGWETDETAGEAACREALEEAGVRGILNSCATQEDWHHTGKSRERGQGSMLEYCSISDLNMLMSMGCKSGRFLRRGVVVNLCFSIGFN